MSRINTSIFKAYDIRGIVPTELDESLAYEIGRGFATLLSRENKGKKLTLVVSSDMRISSPKLKKQLIKGLADSGHDVIDIGLASTPTYYFAVAYLKADGGVQVSASHNPKEYNGFKLTRSNAVPVSGDTGMYQLRDIVENQDFVEIQANAGQVKKMENLEKIAYEQQIKELGIDPTNIKPFKIVVDAANAMGAIDIEQMFSQTKCELVKLNFKLDGNFPSHEADPLKDENLALTQKTVLEKGADLGIAPDGDGDRYFFIDEKGQIVRQEILRGIMAQIALAENPGETVCYDIRPGKITKDMIEEVGGKASVTRVGHSLIKEQMLKENAVFGGESSGHYFYRFKNGTFEAPMVLVLKFLEFLSKKNKPLSAIIAPLQKYFHSGEINSVVDDPQAVMEKLKKRYADAEISTLDGVTITYDNFWFNVRASNTEPKIRLNLEAVSKELMEEKRDEVLHIIRG